MQEDLITSSTNNTQKPYELDEVSEYFQCVIERAEQLEEQMLNEMTMKAKQKNMQILETEWADHKDLWEWMLQQGKSPREVLEFLKSFA